MRIQINNTLRRLDVIPDSVADSRFLAVFAGFEKDPTKDVYFAPLKVPVVQSLLRRIKKKYTKDIIASREVLALRDSEFKLKEIPKSFKYITTPLLHQEIALRYLYTSRGGGLLLDPGLGKTKIVLDYIKLMRFKKSLIVCPKALLFVWEEEVAKHRPDLKIHVRVSLTWDRQLHTINQNIKNNPKGSVRHRTNIAARTSITNKREKDLRLEAEADVVVINYDKAVQGQLYVQDHLKPDFLAIDEGLVKDPTTNRTKALTAIAKRVSSVVIMSGTLVNNTPLDVYSPVRILEPSLVGSGFKKFQDRYCHMCVRKGPGGKILGRFVGSFRDVDEVREILEATSIIMSKEEWLDLPSKKFITVPVPMSMEQETAYYDLAHNYITKIGDEYLEVDSPLTALCKLTQISNGFVYTQGDTSGEELMLTKAPSLKVGGNTPLPRVTYYFESQPKVEALRTLIEETLPTRRFILWYNMTAEYGLISSLLDEMGVSYQTIKGGEKRTGDKVKDFNANPETQVLVCQAKSVNYGITVLGTTLDALEKSSVEVLPDFDPEIYTEVFYSLNYSLELFIQQQDRIHRIGQTHDVEYYLLTSDNPTDNGVTERLEAKKEVRKAILVDVVSKLHEIT